MSPTFRNWCGRRTGVARSAPEPAATATTSACRRNTASRFLSPIHAGIVDPKRFDDRTLVDAPLYRDDDGSQHFLMPPYSYGLGLTLEYFRIPRNVLGLCHGKSTYARCGLIVNTTPLKPEWTGPLVLEFSNSSSTSVRVYGEEGIAQVIFLEADELCGASYADQAGKYQDQRRITSAKL